MWVSAGWQSQQPIAARTLLACGHLSFEGVAVDLELSGRDHLLFDLFEDGAKRLAFGLANGARDDLCFVFADRRFRDGVSDFGGEIIQLDAAFAEECPARDFGAELANVAWPCIALKGAPGLFRGHQTGAALLVQEMNDERFEVGGAFTKRGNFEDGALEPIVEVFAEGALAHHS